MMALVVVLGASFPEHVRQLVVLWLRHALDAGRVRFDARRVVFLTRVASVLLRVASREFRLGF